tara:strand:- start:20349 stop:23822 length:3474 start_codon:yes stop_codon:yes gene_type:complete
MQFTFNPPKSGSISKYSNFYGSGDSYVLAKIAQQEKPIVIICANALESHRLLREIPFFAPSLKIHFLPDWETLPYDNISPHPDLISERLATFYQIMRNLCDILIVPVTTALYRMPPREYLAAYTFFIKRGEIFDLKLFLSQMTLAGYTHVSQVISPGEYSVRGGLIDLFPMGSSLPYRIDRLDNEIETIKTFDVDTQRSIYPVDEVRLLPAREFPFNEDGRANFRGNFRERFEGDPSKFRIYKDIGKGVATAGIEYYLPLFFKQTETLFDYLPDSVLLCLHHNINLEIENFWCNTLSRYKLLRSDISRPIVAPEDLFLTSECFFKNIKSYPRVKINQELEKSQPGVENITSGLPLIQVDRRATNPIEKLTVFIDKFNSSNRRVLLVVESLGRRELVVDHLKQYGLSPKICNGYNQFRESKEEFMLCISPLHNGFILNNEGYAFITESELYATHHHKRNERELRSVVTATDTMLRDLSETKIGDLVVHEQHGIGRYSGLVDMDPGRNSHLQLNEFLLLEYDGGDKLYVPVSQLHLISRYSGTAQESTALHKLGSGQWDKAKKNAIKKVHDTAAELLNLYAQRANKKGYRFNINKHDYEAFSEGFGFEETPDQASAIKAVIQDLCSDKPMDRLICGDVGFGKTEVALRAAFIAISNNKQVAILVPTTLLAEQHFQNFSDRFGLISDQWPVVISEMSRFRSAKDQVEIKKGLSEGRIDIVVGTHKLIQKDIHFKNLGLVIIDEEHRFGVRQKDQLKKFKSEVDILTLTATPIPRSLSMSLEGLRDFSIINTAPQKRLAIKTLVNPYSKGIIREACLREIKRGGQIYYLHNSVDTIQSVYNMLARLLPEIRIEIAHGKMRERDLESVMRDFYRQKFDMLLCTTIIETGLDIPSANTIVIERADKFGLAQLHQLRGRVGRSHHQAYAYLLVPEEEILGIKARKRIDAIKEMEGLGVGYYLAIHDLEIRGAGEFLGESQSGEIYEVGFNLYSSLLDTAIKSLQEGREPDIQNPLGITTEVNLHAPSLLPDSYCNDIHERLVLYKRMAHCETSEQLDNMYMELVDRFGMFPDPVKTLMDCHRIRVLSKPLGISRIDASAENILIQFIANPNIDVKKMIMLVHNNNEYKFCGQDCLKIHINIDDISVRVIKINNVIKELKGTMKH